MLLSKLTWSSIEPSHYLLSSHVCGHNFAMTWGSGLLVPLAILTAMWLIVSRCLQRPTRMRSVVVFVLGDVGRSPRMMYHAESFANNGFETYIVGYRGT